MNQFMQRYQKWGQNFDPGSIQLKPCLRVNTLRINEQELISRLQSNGVKLEKVPFLEHAYFYESTFSLASSIEYLLGYLYLQEAASQLPPQVLLSDFNKELDSKKRILDLCAAPGSKTTQLAQLTGDTIPIFALDDNVPRLDVLKFNVERLKLHSVMAFKKDGRFADDLGLVFDYVLVDAPCSGNFCVEPNFFSERSLLLGVKERSRLQKELLLSAYKSLVAGGTLVYSTCSLEPEEDELIIDWFLKTYTDMKLVPTNLELGDPGLTSPFEKVLDPSLHLSRRFWPHKTGTEGFFIAKLVKTTSNKN